MGGKIKIKPPHLGISPLSPASKDNLPKVFLVCQRGGEGALWDQDQIPDEKAAVDHPMPSRPQTAMIMTHPALPIKARADPLLLFAQTPALSSTKSLLVSLQG